MLLDLALIAILAIHAIIYVLLGKMPVYISQQRHRHPDFAGYCPSSPNLSLSSVSALSVHCFAQLYITVCTISLPLLRMLTSLDISIPIASKTQDYNIHAEHCCRDPVHRVSSGHPIHSPCPGSHLQLKQSSAFGHPVVYTAVQLPTNNH